MIRLQKKRLRDNNVRKHRFKVINNLFDNCKRIVWLVPFLSLLVLTSSCTECKNLVTSVLSPEQCRSLNLTYTKNRISIPGGDCTSTANSKKISLSCAPTSGTLNLCMAASNGSNYYFIFVPNNGSGVFIDTTAGQLNNCTELWAAITSQNPPTDIVGAFYSDSATGDSVTCTDAGGCSATSPKCVSGWDSTNLIPNGTTISLATGTSLLACGFIDTAANGPPPIPGSGVPSIALSNAFFPVSVSGTLNFTSWVDY